MIFFRGGGVMNFKSIFFFPLVILLLPHCGLKVGEPAPSIFKYKLPPSAGYCKEVNYKSLFGSYFLAEQVEGSRDRSQNNKLDKALECLIAKVQMAVDTIDHEYLEKSELIHILNQDFIKTKEITPIIDHILKPDRFNHYILIKDAVADLIEENPDSPFVRGENMCQKRTVGKVIISKQEALAFMDFLKRLSDFLLIVDRSAYEIFDQFFKNKKASPTLLSKENLGESHYFNNHFIPFLSEYFHDDFPEYSQFLSKNFLMENWKAKSKAKYSPFSRVGHIRKHIKTKKMEEVGQPLANMAKLPFSSSDVLTAQNIKYIVLNIYIMKTFFSLYDVNKDSVLSPEEIKPLSCLMTFLLSVFISPEAQSEWGWIQDLYAPESIVNYALKRQTLPSDISGYIDYGFYFIFSDKELEDLSYMDVSRLISVLFLTLFNEIKL